jgi:hypothetical protein
MNLKLLCFALIVTFPAVAIGSEARCRFETGDIGNIQASGTTRSLAMEHAIEACVERREKLYQAARGQSADEDRYSDFIDSCANLDCH